MAYRIAIVDDDISVRRALGRLIRSEGDEAETFASALELLDAVSRGFSCLIVDVHLGGMSGLDLIDALKERGVSVPVIVITAFDDEAMRERACRSGASAYLRKPLDADVLLGAVQKAVGQANAG